MAGRVAAAGAFYRGVTEAADKTAANDGDTPVYNLFKFTVPADDKTFFAKAGNIILRPRLPMKPVHYL